MMIGRVEIVARKMGLAKTEDSVVVGGLGELFSTPKGYVDEVNSSLFHPTDWGGYRHNYGGNKKGRGYYCTPFFKIDVGLNEEFSMALEMFDAEKGTINRQPFGVGMFCAGRIANWMETDKASGRFVSKAKEIEVWHYAR